MTETLENQYLHGYGSPREIVRVSDLRSGDYLIALSGRVTETGTVPVPVPVYDHVGRIIGSRERGTDTVYVRTETGRTIAVDGDATAVVRIQH